MNVELKIKRYNPEQDKKPHWETYEIEMEEDDRVLDALHEVKWHHDGTLSFRRSCAHGVCGSDAMVINGANALACARYHNLLHRHGDLVEVSNRSNLTNSFCSGIIQTDRQGLYVTPTYHAQKLYATLAGSRALRA